MLFVEYTGIKVKQFRETLLLHMGNVKKSVAKRTRHKRQYDKRMNERQMQSIESKVVSSKALDASLVVTECSRTKSDEHITSSSSGSYIIHVVNADIRPTNDQVPSVECKLMAVGSPFFWQWEHLPLAVGTDTTSGNSLLAVGMPCAFYSQHKEESFQSNKPCKNQDSPDFREFFVINELKAQLQAKNSTINNLKKQIKNVLEKSNEAKVKHDIDVIETINIELEQKVAKLRKENETLKKHYKGFSASGKWVYNCSIKNKLRKLTGNNVNTKFAKPSILGKPILQPLRNQSVVRQPTTFRSKRPKFSRPRFTSQVDVNNVLSKPVTPHYLPKVRKSVFVNLNHVIASVSSRNNFKESYGLNDMAHNHYLEEAKKKKQDKNINLKPSVMHTTSLQNTIDGSKPIPGSNNQTSRSLPVSKSSYGMLNVSPTPYVPLSKKEYEILFQPLFDEYFNPLLRTVSLDSTVVVAPRAVDPADSPLSTTTDQDVPSASISPTIRKFNLKSLIK
nr:hypothetical protein [Tanacetum cinerariifolium]